MVLLLKSSALVGTSSRTCTLTWYCIYETWEKCSQALIKGYPSLSPKRPTDAKEGINALLQCLPQHINFLPNLLFFAYIVFFLNSLANANETHSRPSIFKKYLHHYHGNQLGIPHQNSDTIPTIRLQKAFDRVDFNYIWETLHAKGLDNNFLHLVCGLILGGTIKIHINGQFFQKKLYWVEGSAKVVALVSYVDHNLYTTSPHLHSRKIVPWPYARTTNTPYNLYVWKAFCKWFSNSYPNIKNLLPRGWIMHSTIQKPQELDLISINL